MRPLPLLALLALLTGCAGPDVPSAADRAPVPDPVEDAVIYEVFVRAFTPEGTLQALVPRLDELRELGVTTLWLMPIHPIGEERRKGTLGSPYSIRDYKAVDPAYGSVEDVRALVAAAHARGMTVILDLVANHTAWDHPWVTAHPEWYRRDASGAITHPPGTDWTDVAQLDHDHPEVRAALRRTMRFWVEDVGVDGFRADVAELVPADFWREAIAELRAIRPVLMLAEGAAPWLHEVGFDLTYAWTTYHAKKRVWQGAPADTLAALVLAEADRYPVRQRLRFTTNHDETAWDDTPLALFGGTRGAQAAFVLAATLPGVPLVYNGQEVGDPQRIPLFERTTIDWAADPAMRAFTRDVLRLRAERVPLRRGSFEPIEHPAARDVLAFRRVHAGDTVTVVVNVRDRAVRTELPGLGEIELPPYGWRVE